MPASAAPPRWRRGNLFVALVGLTLIPVVLAGDTVLAVARGWSATARSNYGLAMLFLCGAWIIAAVAVFLLALAIGPARRILRRAAWPLVSVAASLLLGWGLAETLLAFVAPGAPFHSRPPGTTYVFDPDPFTFYHVSGQAYSSINSRGLRGPELPPRHEALRVLCVGGSTTECYYLDDDECWPTQLALRLAEQAGRPAWAGAAAVSEYATAQHLRFLADSPLLGAVDAVVVMPGLNDFVRLLQGFDTGAAAGPWWSRSRLLEMVKAQWNRRSGAGWIVDRTGEGLRLRRQGGDINEPAGGLPIDDGVVRYTDQLRALCQIARQRGVRLVLVTQPVLWTDFLSAEARARLNLARETPDRRPWTFLEAVRLADAFERYNEATLEVAAAEGVEVCDAALRLSGREELFYDDYHLNEAGCRELGKLLAECLSTGAAHGEPVTPRASAPTSSR